MESSPRNVRDGLVDLDIFCKRGDDVLMPGTATVALPQRNAS